VLWTWKNQIAFYTNPSTGSVELLRHKLGKFLLLLLSCTQKKRWGVEGPRVSVGSTVAFGGLLEQIVREHTSDRVLQFAQVIVANIAYLGT
jgi:hypothetical protein